jgi:hypothetical protein
MTRINKFLGLLFALALAALAFPASAANKLMLVSISTWTNAATPQSLGNVIPSGATSILLLDFANKEPNGANSVMKYVDAFIPTDVKYLLIQNQTTTVNVGSNGRPVSCPAPTQTSLDPGANGTFGLGINNANPSITLNNFTGAKPQGHFCMYFAVTTATAVCTLEQWKADANTGNSATGGQPFFDFNNPTQPYSLPISNTGCTGLLGCDTTNNKGGTLDPESDIAFIGAPALGLVRGNNTTLVASGDGTVPNCTVVPFQLTLGTDPGTGGVNASFVVPDALNQSISAKWVALWPAVIRDPNGWTDQRPLVSWGITNPNRSITGQYTPALACNDDGTGFVNLNSAQLIALLPTIPNDCGNPPTIPDGPFCAANKAGYTQYAPGKTALVCVAQHGWTSVGPPPPNANPPLVQYWDILIDEGDSYIIPN